MTVDERFDRIEQLIEKQTRRFDAVDERFARIDERFAGINERFDRIDERFDRIDERFDRIDERFDRIDQSIESLNQRVGRVEQSVDTLSRYFLEFRTETIKHPQAIDNRLEVLAPMVTNMDSRFAPLNKAVLDFGIFSSQVLADQWKQKDSAFALEGRVARLEEIVSTLIKPAA